MNEGGGHFYRVGSPNMLRPRRYVLCSSRCIGMRLSSVADVNNPFQNMKSNVLRVTFRCCSLRL